jgi:acylphosphatase
VSFRFAARRQAQELGVAGFVRNEPDGSVYAEAEGEEVRVRKFLDWLGQGPGAARVDRVETEEMEDVLGEEGFRIEY